ALNGLQVIIGSRDAARAASRAEELNAELGGDYLQGLGNAEAAAAADVVVLSVPYDAHKATLEGVKDQLADKVLVDITVPLKPPKVRTVHLPEGQSAALEAQALLGENVKVVAAFQNVSAEMFGKPDEPIDCDVLICGNDPDARDHAVKLAEAAGMQI